MIFIVEPGGWTAEKATPLSASSAPVWGSMAAIPANRPACAAIAARSIAGLIVLVTSWPEIGATLARIRWPASSLPPGVPASWFWNTCSRPSSPTLAPAGYPSASYWAASVGGIGPRTPTISDATSGIGDVRPGPSASGVPSLAKIAPRAPSSVRRERRSPRRRPGNRRVPAKRMVALEPLPSSGTSSVSRKVPNSRVRASIRTGIHAPERRPTWVQVSEMRVAVAAAVR